MVQTFLEKNAFQQRILIPEHQTLIRCIAVRRLQTVKILFVNLNGILELLDVLGTPFPECSLGLTVPLLPLFRGGVYLTYWSATNNDTEQFQGGRRSWCT
jgi:hypothetical protein